MGSESVVYAYRVERENTLHPAAHKKASEGSLTSSLSLIPWTVLVGIQTPVA